MQIRKVFSLFQTFFRIALAEKIIHQKKQAINLNTKVNS